MAHRYLFEQMVRRELRQKYKGSALGVALVPRQPARPDGRLLPHVRRALQGRATAADDYPLFLLVGLVVWIFFSQAVLSAAPSLLDQGALDAQGALPARDDPGRRS